LQKFSELSIPH